MPSRQERCQGDVLFWEAAEFPAEGCSSGDGGVSA